MNVKEIICDPDNLYEAMLRSVRQNKWKESSQRFLNDYLTQIFKLENELRNQTYKTRKPTAFVKNEEGKIRVISSLDVRDRVVRHVLCDNLLLPKFLPRIIHDNGASIEGKGLSFTRRRFEEHIHSFYRKNGNSGWILFGDFSKFYDNVIHDLAKTQLLKPFDNDEYLSWLLDIVFKGFQLDVGYMTDYQFAHQNELLFNRFDHETTMRTCDPSLFDGSKMLKKSIGIGDQISQVIGVVYPTDIDTYVKTVRSIRYYGRYMDDWYLISNSKEELLDVLSGIKSEASKLGIFINQKKTRIEPFDIAHSFLQVRYQMTKTGHLIKRLNPKRITSMRRKLKKLVPKVQSGIIELEDMDNLFRSWVGSFRKMLSRQSLDNLTSLYEELYDCQVVYCGKKIFIYRKEYDEF